MCVEEGMWVILYGYRLKCECLTFSLPFRPVLNLEKICMLIESVIMSHHVITDYISSRDYISSCNHILSRDHTNKFITSGGCPESRPDVGQQRGIVQMVHPTGHAEPSYCVYHEP